MDGNNNFIDCFFIFAFVICSNRLIIILFYKNRIDQKQQPNFWKIQIRLSEATSLIFEKVDNINIKKQEYKLQTL